MLVPRVDFLFTHSVARLCPVFGSQNLMGCWLSLLPETTRPLVGCQSTHLTSAPCPEHNHQHRSLTTSYSSTLFFLFFFDFSDDTQTQHRGAQLLFPTL